ncbi:hypothetical protein MMC10_007101 [Thelotrema lepadinum]|nr:hypothetical protein [Thelotrema lepadinum]
MSQSFSLRIKSSPFYGEWSGHPVKDLETFHSHILSLNSTMPIIYFAGDSSLDNKAWVPSPGPGGEPLPVEVPNLYTGVLDPAQPKPDVAFWLNHLLGQDAACLNTAVEASLLRERDKALLPHDKFIRNHIREQDILVVSVGANDIALRPTAGTIFHMVALAWLTPTFLIARGWAPSLYYFRRLFRDKIQAYIKHLISKQKPRAVIVCMIYFPLEAGLSDRVGWADLALKLLGYNLWPGRLQAAIRKIYEIATKPMTVEGTEIVPCALFDVLDGKRAEDYVARAEPSVLGGRQIALYLEKILGHALNRSDEEIGAHFRH